MSTIRDVARRAGVSTMTVSRVLNNAEYIRPETRRRVEQAIIELGYVPNTLARSLRSRQTGTIALVVTDITNPFFTTIARGVEDTAVANGFNVIFCNTDESEEKQSNYLNVLMQKRVDGILLVPAQSAPASFDRLMRAGIALVVLDRRVTSCEVDSVRCDSEGGAYDLTRILLDLGHRRIAVLSGPISVSTAEDRVSGHLRALAENGLAGEARIYRGAFTVEAGREMAQAALAAPEPPTALFAGNNFIAIGAARAVRAAGLRVPEDIALVAFDDLPSALLVDPFFTVAAQPAYEMGRRATELLLDRMAGPKAEPYRNVVLPVEVIVRASSGDSIS